MEIKPIARFRSPFSSKFGIPKQAGLVAELEGQIVFEPEYRNPDFLRGMEGFDFLWLIWEFSANRHKANSPVVRPPVLGGNEKVGVFATRSPFRPNNIGLSSVRISRIEWETSKGPVVHVKGADLMDGTPIYDIKPYVVYADCHSDARSGFVDDRKWAKLDVEISEEMKEYLKEQGLTDAKIEILKEVLAQDPRPHYQKDPHKVYGMPYEGMDIHFSVSDHTLTVVK
ncbi:tRNA (N6-threonylcarbamoyladenosine(37)-N6)-methyltransferase TrmO [Segatella copri]|jgi:tRNA-Thr(GGU) m(6)t(6)A37 methyltransferase TsaA|uniref:tRNA (N6-threonylcarbamoyladenosine(37)-N6)-methyltransferase TrmO n=1 Tax=Segatella copri TaxID=165179 RepID=UPI001931C0B3|nr:tRNA (N6-threonylcarbamoyladenosine(37)-N6)-methyltransferase TrmO [Segatella copri]MBM0129785.1 tRNA (N6-threonylcarbamoyladenosine(37)-N6)-methyltransferase TrmO [Segatella copri]